jgi:hypothetical protein
MEKLGLSADGGSQPTWRGVSAKPRGPKQGGRPPASYVDPIERMYCTYIIGCGEHMLRILKKIEKKVLSIYLRY